MQTNPHTTLYRLLCCAAALFAAATASAQDKPVMTWTILDLPPAMILADGKPVDGIAAKRLQMIMARMPEYRHEFQVMPAARIVATLSQPDAKGCLNNGLITPEREKRFYMSATNLSFPLSVIAKPDTLKKLQKNAAGEVLPAALFDRVDLVGIVNPGRSYTALYDALLERRSPQAQIQFIPSTRSGANVMQMVESDRAHYTIDYEYTMTHLMHTESEFKGAHLQALPLAGGVMNKSGIMCPRNAWGYEMIRKIDAVVSRLLPDPAFQNQTNRWISPQMSAHLKPHIDAFYAHRMRNPPVFMSP